MLASILHWIFQFISHKMSDVFKYRSRCYDRNTIKSMLCGSKFWYEKYTDCLFFFGIDFFIFDDDFSWIVNRFGPPCWLDFYSFVHYFFEHAIYIDFLVFPCYRALKWTTQPSAYISVMLPNLVVITLLENYVYFVHTLDQIGNQWEIFVYRLNLPVTSFYNNDICKKFMI